MAERLAPTDCSPGNNRVLVSQDFIGSDTWNLVEMDSQVKKKKVVLEGNRIWPRALPAPFLTFKAGAFDLETGLRSYSDFRR